MVMGSTGRYRSHKKATMGQKVKQNRAWRAREPNEERGGGGDIIESVR